MTSSLIAQSNKEKHRLEIKWKRNWPLRRKPKMGPNSRHCTPHDELILGFNKPLNTNHKP